jgi:hypothetical protein
MTDNRKIRLTPPSSEPAYKVGYRKPPAESQFKPGRSGNPRGRRKGARNKLPALNEERLKGIIVEEAYRTIKIAEGERQVTIPMAKAVVRALAVNAARGQLRSQQSFATLLSETERANKALHDKMLDAALEYKVQWDREPERRAKQGISAPDPIPHPDDIVIDMRTGEALIKGPLTKEDKVKLDRMYALIEEADRAVKEMADDLERQKTKRSRRAIETEIGELRQARQSLANVIGEPKRRGSPGQIVHFAKSKGEPTE